MFDAIAEQRPVREVGDRIVKGLIGELLLELLALGDVAQVDDDPADRGVVQQVGEQTLGVQQATVAVANAKLERLGGSRRARKQPAERRLHERSVLFGDVIQESVGRRSPQRRIRESARIDGLTYSTVVSDASTRITSLECWTSALRRTSLSVRSALSRSTRLALRGRLLGAGEPDHPHDHEPEQHDRGGTDDDRVRATSAPRT